MAAPLWLHALLGWRPATKKGMPRCQRVLNEAIAPNIADIGSDESLRIAGDIYQQLGIPRGRKGADIGDASQDNRNHGTPFEIGVETDIRRSLSEQAPSRGWTVARKGDASDYAQFHHLGELQSLLEDHPTLRTTLGRDYHIKTDVLVGVDPPQAGRLPFLHAAISCKWSIRSDRVQNVRHEFATLVRHRRGRLPHLVLVTIEPSPSRLVSIGRGTGEVDAVYHLLYEELDRAVKTCGTTARQQSEWAELVQQRRVKPFHELVTDLILS
ncbi:hypothetical protein JOF56_003433 [Kibdelosporangium banguiense]|uniref:Restriction endonuclease n=1 Tax=Kibdelosporangium banguiense TaxID=1365924 RepID=A0ABS4TGQ7_9PSEU|nr:NgoMIV family type II restriction endonuclease [Kibdelosporangium banguiense]MBP2323048.1 hypothetical protein [Kibdelosporangium banguiense]